MCFDCEGSSPSQMIAVWLARLARCRSTQFKATFRTPSSNHLIEMLPGANDQLSILVGVFIQSRRLACSAQKPLGSSTERAYISRYLASSIQARLAHSAGTLQASSVALLPTKSWSAIALSPSTNVMRCASRAVRHIAVQTLVIPSALPYFSAKDEVVERGVAQDERQHEGYPNEQKALSLSLRSRIPYCHAVRHDKRE